MHNAFRRMCLRDVVEQVPILFVTTHIFALNEGVDTLFDALDIWREVLRHRPDGLRLDLLVHELLVRLHDAHNSCIE